MLLSSLLCMIVPQIRYKIGLLNFVNYFQTNLFLSKSIRVTGLRLFKKLQQSTVKDKHKQICSKYD